MGFISFFANITDCFREGAETLPYIQRYLFFRRGRHCLPCLKGGGTANAVTEGYQRPVCHCERECGLFRRQGRLTMTFPRLSLRAAVPRGNPFHPSFALGQTYRVTNVTYRIAKQYIEKLEELYIAQRVCVACPSLLYINLCSMRSVVCRNNGGNVGVYYLNIRACKNIINFYFGII